MRGQGGAERGGGGGEGGEEKRWRERAPRKREKEEWRCSRDEENRRKHPTGTIEGRGGEPRIEDEEETLPLSLSMQEMKK